MMPEPVANALEPAAREMIGEACPDWLVALASLAISARRIADGIEEIQGGTHHLRSLHDIEIHLRKAR